MPVVGDDDFDIDFVGQAPKLVHNLAFVVRPAMDRRDDRERSVRRAIACDLLPEASGSQVLGVDGDLIDSFVIDLGRSVSN